MIAAVKAAGRRGIAIKADMGREEEVARVFDTVDKELGRLTHLVYNAGITGGYGRLESADPKMMREVLDLNVLGALLSEGRDPAHVGEAWRAGRRDGAGLLDGGEPRQPGRICLVRGLEGRDRLDDHRAVEGARASTASASMRWRPG